MAGSYTPSSHLCEHVSFVGGKLIFLGMQSRHRPYTRLAKCLQINDNKFVKLSRMDDDIQSNSTLFILRKSSKHFEFFNHNFILNIFRGECVYGCVRLNYELSDEWRFTTQQVKPVCISSSEDNKFLVSYSIILPYIHLICAVSSSAMISDISRGQT